MTHKLTRWEWRKAMLASDLSDGAKVLLCALHENINEASGQAWPSVATLMKATGKSESAIHRANREVRDKGWIITTERPGTTSMNKIALPGGVSLLAPLIDEGGVNTDRGGGVISGTPGVSLLAPEPYLEPSTLNHREEPADAGMGMEGKNVREATYTLPVATTKGRAAWVGHWPAEHELLNVRIHEMQEPKSRIILAMLDLMGHRLGADDLETMVARGAAKAKINELLNDDAVFALRDLSAAAGLRKTVLADWLAHNEFVPLVKGEVDAKAA